MVLCSHFEPKWVVIAQRFHFHKHDQAAGESIADYDTSLRKLACQCKFGDHLEETLCHHYLCRLRHEAIQRRLLSEVDLTYAKAMEIASSMEAADRDTESLKGSESVLRKLHSNSGKGKGFQVSGSGKTRMIFHFERCKQCLKYFRKHTLFLHKYLKQLTVLFKRHFLFLYSCR